MRACPRLTHACHFRTGAVGAAPTRADERRHDTLPHRSLLEVLQYAGAAGLDSGSAPKPGACPDLEAACSDRWLKALWLEGAPPDGEALPLGCPLLSRANDLGLLVIALHAQCQEMRLEKTLAIADTNAHCLCTPCAQASAW